MSVTGYQRIQQLNQFFPGNDVQKVLKTKIGKNEMVIVSDFLLGDDYTKTENPRLPTGLLDEIRNHCGMTFEKWEKNIKALLKNYTIDNGIHQFEEVAYVLRYITMYPLAMNHSSFINTVVRRCEELYAKEIPRFMMNNHNIAPLPHHHFTRKNKKRKTIADNYMRAICGCLRTIGDCEYTYKAALQKHY